MAALSTFALNVRALYQQQLAAKTAEEEKMKTPPTEEELKRAFFQSLDARVKTAAVRGRPEVTVEGRDKAEWVREYCELHGLCAPKVNVLGDSTICYCADE